ncbi:efflux RND transporter periplasmic adaptor subunit [Mangrovimicrobium sediminis]|nr:efflux RND transporter periplasmic adaptor subunit [Haliea sp. SAOS-164]
MNVQWQRRLTWLAVLLAIVAALAYGFRPQPRLVDIAVASRAPMQVSIQEEGRTRVIDRYVITAPVAGTVCRVDLDVGDPIEKGEVLARINPLQSQPLDPRSRAEASARVSAAEAALLAARENIQVAASEADLAEKELVRLAPLVQQGHISEERLDQAEAFKRSSDAALRSARFAEDVANHELEAARTALRHAGEKSSNPEDVVQVLAPITGSILKIYQECEGVISPSQPLMEIGDTRSLEIETDVLSPDAVKIRPGMSVLYERWGGEAPLVGQVRRVEPVGFTKISALGVEEQRVLIISDITSDPAQWQTLGDGYRVDSRFILWEMDDVLQVPASALFRIGDLWALFVVDDDRARQRQVDVGQRNGLSAQVLGGLTEGEMVITHPDKALAEGMGVKSR